MSPLLFRVTRHDLVVEATAHGQREQRLLTSTLQDDVQPNKMSSGQIDFICSPARTMHPRVAHVWMSRWNQENHPTLTSFHRSITGQAQEDGVHYAVEDREHRPLDRYLSTMPIER